ncbi:phage terminase large subunit [Bacillus infantis]|uniref:Phage terminase large subunit n=1 Tax=Bacillus infantis TaxID=324767 RepID=A0A5D4RAA2_9BACI|nr:phage terminase large subunit [Bacillus infantis]TYS46758.1 phage terminase large subunit [Bacillus infantis]
MSLNNLTEKEKRELIFLLEKKQLGLVKDDYTEYVEYVHEGLYQHAKHTRYLCNIVQEAIDNKKRMLSGEMPLRNQYIALSIPPRHGKSMTITETAPSFYLGQFPNDRVILAGYNTDFATKFGKKNKEKVERFGRKIFGNELKKGSSSATDWDIEGHRGGVISRGILSGVTGEGADLMIIDDPVKTREEADSQVTRDKIWGEWIDSFSTRLHPGAIVIIIMTRWHENDLVGRLLDPEYGEPLPWKVINLPMECEDENDPLGRKIGDPLWDRFDKEYIATRKKMSASSFHALYQGRPTSQEGNLVKREWWKKYIELPRIPRKIMSVDATFKDADTSDFVSIQVWGKSGVNAYLIDRKKARMDFPTTLKSIKEMKAKHPDISGIFIEDKANGSAIISMLRSKMPGIIPVNPKGGKISRVNAVSDYIQAGNVWLPKDEPWTEEFIEEWAAFPKGKNDDDVDSASQALNKLFYYYAEIPEPSDPFVPTPEEKHSSMLKKITGGAPPSQMMKWG